MKGLSLWQPWASLVAWREKAIETRPWGTSYRGPIAIHATQLFPRDAIELCHQEPFRFALKAAGVVQPADLPRGAIVAVARLVDILATGGADPRATDPWPRRWVQDLSGQERAFGDFSCHRYGWFLEDVRALPEPILCRGAQGLWSVPADVLAKIGADHV